MSDGTTPSGNFNLMTVGGSNINVFVGTGDPDSNGDGMFDITDDPEANGAIGLVLNNLEAALALMPVAAAPTPVSSSVVATTVPLVPGTTPSCSARDQKVSKEPEALAFQVERTNS